MNRISMCMAVVLLGLSAAAGQPLQTAGKTIPSPKEKGLVMITTTSGLKYLDTRIGHGVMPARGQECVVHYTGWLDDGRGHRGKKFDSSLDRGQPLAIPIGVGRVIQGWDEGLLTMKVGGKRTLYIPSRLGYGSKGAGRDIPPHADLIFDVELLSVQ